MAEKTKIITVFGSSRPEEGHADYEEALDLGRALATAGFAVCTGGYGGVMEGVSRGASESGGRVLAVTSTFFRSRANRWVQEESSVATWQERLFELVRLGDGYVACKGGTGTLVELAVVWEMLNKKAMEQRPFVVLGDFWQPILDRVREVERGHASRWGESRDPLVYQAPSPAEAAEFLARRLEANSSHQHKSRSGPPAK
ncbi:MAG TPA: LOG family protein [Candidatus Acidoferrales bacterium]|nr:LOG family protein [Candidatus Acidoferrales bacterium]